MHGGSQQGGAGRKQPGRRWAAPAPLGGLAHAATHMFFIPVGRGSKMQGRGLSGVEQRLAEALAGGKLGFKDGTRPCKRSSPARARPSLPCRHSYCQMNDGTPRDGTAPVVASLPSCRTFWSVVITRSSASTRAATERAGSSQMRCAAAATPLPSTANGPATVPARRWCRGTRGVGRVAEWPCQLKSRIEARQVTLLADGHIAQQRWLATM